MAPDHMLLALAWPIDLALTVASHGWVLLEPWRWDGESGTLSRAERIAGLLGTIAVRQYDATTLAVSAQGFDEAAHPEIRARATRWVSAEWDPRAAIAALSRG